MTPPPSTTPLSTSMPMMVGWSKAGASDLLWVRRSPDTRVGDLYRVTKRGVRTVVSRECGMRSAGAMAKDSGYGEPSDIVTLAQWADASSGLDLVAAVISGQLDEQLVALGRAINLRQKALRTQRSQIAMASLTVGARVRIREGVRPAHAAGLVGTVLSIARTRVVVAMDNGQRWRVSPSILDLVAS